MNREMKRMMQRQGQVEADGSPARRHTDQQRPRPQLPPQRKSFGAWLATLVREIRSELRQVAWPTRAEVVSSTTVVIIALVLLISLIFGLNWLFSHGETFLFKK